MCRGAPQGPPAPGPLTQLLSAGLASAGSAERGASELRGHVEGLDLAPEAARLLSEGWEPGSLLLDYLEGQRCTDVEVGPLLPEREPSQGLPSQGCRVRNVHYRMAVPPNPFCPKTSRFTVTFRVFMEEGSLVIDTTTVTHDVPFGEAFCVQDRAVLSQGDRGVSVTKVYCAVFMKSTMFRSQILGGVRLEQEGRFGIFMAALHGLARRQRAQRGAAAAVSRLSLGDGAAVAAAPWVAVAPPPDARDFSPVREYRQRRYQRPPAAEAKEASSISVGAEELLGNHKASLAVLCMALLVSLLAGSAGGALESVAMSAASAASWWVQAWGFPLSGICLCLYPFGLLLWMIQDGSRTCVGAKASVLGSKFKAKATGLETE